MKSCWPGWLVVCLSGILAVPAALAEAPHADSQELEQVLPADAALSLHDVFLAARERHPELGLLQAWQQRARAEDDFAARLFPDAWRVGAFFLDDRWLDETGFSEDELSLSAPLWMPGERRARRELAEAAEAASASAAMAFDWRVSGSVRSVLWQLRQSLLLWQLSQAQQAQLEQVLDQSRIRLEAGDIARADHLAVVQELAGWRSETFELAAVYQDTLRLYQSLTGLSAMPEQLLEPRSTREDITEQHLALRAARDRLQEAEAVVESLQQAGSARPSLQFYWRETRADDLSDEIGSLGLGLDVPIGRSPARLPEVARASEAAAQARAAYLARKRSLELDLHEAAHRLHVLEQQFDNSRQLLEAAKQRYELDLVSLDLGEIAVPEWLRRAAAFRQASQAHELLILQRGAAIAAYNQAVGEKL